MSTPKRKPKILFSALGVPVAGHGGGTLTVFILIRHFLAAGYDVSVAYLEPTRSDADLYRKAEAGLKEMGVSEVRGIIHPVDMHRQSTVDGGLAAKIRNRLTFNPDYYRPWHLAGEQARAAVADIRPDFCFLYGFETMAAFLAVDDVPKVASFGVMPYKIEAARNRILWRTSPVRWLVANMDFAVKRRHFMHNVSDLAHSVGGIIAFAANERDECRRVAPDANVVYCPNPIPDEGPSLADLPPRENESGSHRVTIVGHLRGTATQAGHDFLVREIIPALKRRGWFDRLRFDIIGKFAPPAWLAKALDYPNVTFTGFVENFAAAVHRADAYLVCIPDDVGNRSRISSAWALECCVVTHASSVAGMPEIEHGANALVGRTGEDIADLIIRACTDRELNERLRKAGRRSYDAYYRPDVAFPAIERFARTSARLAA